MPLLAAATVLGVGAVPQAPVARPYVGVTYVERVEESPRPIRVHVVQIDLSAPGIRFTLSPPAGPREVVRQSTLDFVRQAGAQVGINAHYFWPWPSADPDADVIGIAASEGRVFSAFETPVQRYALLEFAPGLNIDRENQASLVHVDPADPARRRVREAVTLWTTLAGSAQIVDNGTPSIPVYRDADHPDGALEPGGPRQYSNAGSWYDAINARTAIGLSRDARTLTLFTVDAAGGSRGMTVGEVAAMLVRDYAVWQALNLDGGGSTTMVLADPGTGEPRLVNTPSDTIAGRAVGSSLAVFARRP